MPPVSIIAAGAADIPPAVVSAACGAAVCAALLWRRDLVRQTTLWPAWSFALIAAATVTSVEVAAAFSPGARWAAPLRFAAAVLFFCPQIAVLGAKRPQNAAWPLIVLTLWVVLALPALEALVIRPDRPLEIHVALAWLLPALTALGLLDRLPTRFWPSAVAIAAGQVCLTLEHWPLVTISWGPVGTACGMALLAMAALLVAMDLPRRSTKDAWTGVWLDFRDRFGAFWSLRVMERVNVAAHDGDWGYWLGWSGFRRLADGEETAANVRLPPHAQANVRNLLRRFVAPDWIARRIDGAPRADSE